MTGMDVALAVLVLVVLALVAAQTLAARAFRARALGLAGRVARPLPAASPPSAGAIPAQVRRAAERAGAVPPGSLAPGAPIPVAATLRQAVELRLRPGGPFVAFEAWQVISLVRPGFLWEARSDLGPLTRVRVIDGFVDGAGILEARALGSIPVARAGGPDAALAEAMRYLAELPWAPDAMLLNPDLRWTAGAGGTADAVLDTTGGEARVTFRFDAAGDITAVEARGRPATGPDGKPARLDWRASFGTHAGVGSRRLPITAEAGYVYPTGYEAYFRCRLTAYDLA